MSDLEFEVLDQLYFLISFHELEESLSIEQGELITILDDMIKKDWIRVYRSEDVELSTVELDLKNNYNEYRYLASKKGLFAHNSN